MDLLGPEEVVDHDFQGVLGLGEVVEVCSMGTDDKFDGPDDLLVRVYFIFLFLVVVLFFKSLPKRSSGRLEAVYSSVDHSYPIIIPWLI